ncbi:MAG: hypothetical protein C0582_03445 [Alphaproteobacteria bacterium]|nr:MAG: hypothetical protein C0582_03445 [Alphaproteobacteria bacterium]
MVKNINVQDKALDNKIFQSVFDKYVGQKMSMGRMGQLKQDLTAALRNNGFIFSRIVIPPQKVDQGKIQVNVLHAKIGRVVFKGRTDLASDKFREVSQTLKDTPLLTRSIYEEQILRMTRTHGVKTTTTLVPPKKPGEPITLEVQLEEDLGSVSMGVHNRVSHEIAPWIFTSDLTLKNGFGLNERTTWGVNWGPRQAGLALFFLDNETPTGIDDLNFTTTAATIKTHPTRRYSSLQARNKFDQLAFGFNYPLLLQRYDEVIVRLKYNMENQKNAQKATNQTTKNRRRFITAAIRYDFSDQYLGVNFLDFGYDWGLKGTGTRGVKTAGDQSHIDASSVFMTFMRQQQLPDNFYAKFSMKAQYNTKKAVQNGRLVLGGYPLDLSHPNASYSGDGGYEGNLELGYVVGRDLGDVDWANLTIYGSLSHGQTWLRQPSATEKKLRKLSCGTVGIRHQLIDRFNIFVEQGFPFRHTIGTTKFAKKTYFGLTYNTKI